MPSLPPGPGGYLLFNGGRAAFRDKMGYMRDAWRKYGDIVRVALGPGFDVYLLTNPEHYKHVLIQHADNYRKHPMFVQRLREITGNGLVASEGDYWKRQRRTMQPLFHTHRYAALSVLIGQVIEETLQRWEGSARTGAPLQIDTEMMRLTTLVAVKTLFSNGVESHVDQLLEALNLCLGFMNKRLDSQWNPPLWFPLPETRRYHRAMKILDGLSYRLLRERRQSNNRPQDLLTMLVEARDSETGEAMTDVQIRDELIALVAAGSETTAMALTWAWYEMARNPAVAERLRQEATQVLGGRLPTFDDLPRLTYARMVFEETLRLYPPAWMITRTPLREDTISGYQVRGGGTSMMALCIFLTHRHPDFWERPDEFMPERFAPGQSERNRFAYIPFGTGQRKCIGERLSIIEGTMFLAAAAQRFKLEMPPDHPEVRPVPFVTLHPDRPIHMRAVLN